MPLLFTDLVQSIANHFDRSETAPAPLLTSAQAIGAYGERVAAAFVRRHGYRVLTRNYRTTRGEIDLVCRHGDLLVFVEVRTRSHLDFIRPAETIGTAKQEALRYASSRYLKLLDREGICYRFDAVEVIHEPGEPPVCTLLMDFFA